MVIWWGKDLVLLYNDAWQPILGTKHPRALGRPGQEVWSEIWDIIGVQLQSVLETAQATWSDDMLLLVDRYGYLEEAYFTYSYSPIFLETGAVGGAFTAVTETTRRVIGERRLSTLRELAANTVEAKSVKETCRIAMATLTNNPYDIPFALLYLVEQEGKQARLVETVRLDAGAIVSPKQVDLTQQQDCWKLAQVQKTGEAQVIGGLLDQFEPILGGAWDEPSRSAIVLPITQSSQKEQLAGLLVLGISPRREFDDEYRGFFDLVASHVTTAIANAQAYEEECKRAEALAELDRAKTTFFSNISHEFRTPLTLMLGPLQETLNRLDGQLPPEEREQLEMVQHNGLRLLKLVNTLLDFSRLEAGRVKAIYEPTDLAAFTTDLSSVFRSTIEQAGLQLIVTCESLTELVYVDREMWEKIVLNLLSNAFKFTFSGEIVVTLRQVQSQVELMVRDSGIGIPAAELPRLFERFHRVEGAQGRTQEGSGIGLALVQELVWLHGGQVEVASTEGAGTTLTITIPMGMAHLPAEQVQPARSLTFSPFGTSPYVEEALRWLPEEDIGNWEYAATTVEVEQTTGLPHRSLSASSLPPARILLVDDNADMRSYVKRLLLSQGYEVETAIDGLAAFTIVQQQVPDLVLTDVMMPRLDGFGLLGELRSAPTTREIPVILLSARAGEEARIEGLEAGADDYLTKPFSARELLARVEANLKLAQLRREATQREQALRLEAESVKQKIETILSSISDGFFTLDRHWRYTYANDRLCELAGKPREELLGHNNWEVFPAAIGTEVYVQFHRALHEQISLQFEYFYLPWNRWFEYRVYPSADGLTIFAVEVTDRKRSNLMLVEQKQLLERVASGHSLDECLAAVCHAIASLNSGTRACFLLADEARQTFSHVIMPDLPSSFRQGIENFPINDLCIGTCGEAVYRGEPVTCADIANDDRWSQGWRDLCLGQGILACHSTPIMGMNNLPLGSLMLCFDEVRHPTQWEYQLADFGTQIASIVFERDRSLVALQSSEAQSRDILESINDGFLALDEHWRYTYLNQSAATLLGRTVEDSIGKTIWEEYPGLTGTEFERVYRRAMNDRIAGSATAFYPDHDCWYEARAYPATQGIAIYFKDVTAHIQLELERDRLLQQEQTAREEAERANRIKDEFLAVLSHELRSPLNPILGWSRLLQNNKLDEARTKQALTTIERNAKLQAELIEDLLDVSRILQGKLSLTVSPVHLASTIKAAIETVRLAAEAKSIALETNLDTEIGLVSGDATRLQQVVWNLLSNAVKFTPASGLVTVQLEQVDHQACITVSDTGKGIAPDFIPYVFDYFRQADSATTRKFGGLGLGLAIVRHLVELHGGTIGADSPGEGLGATFTVNLPLMQTSPTVEQGPQLSLQSLTLQGINVLVVDDETDTRDFIEFLLQQFGARVTTASSAAAALTALMRVQPDVLLSDIGMPDVDGYMLMQQVRRLSPEQGGRIPAIALTAYAGEFDQRQAMAVGFQRHVPKPVEPETLVRVVVTLLDSAN
jgi:PAS domain S-box-containing protein